MDDINLGPLESNSTSDLTGEERFRTQVANGIDMLNEYHPGWQDEINFAELRMLDVKNCILGQLGYDYVGVDKKYGMMWCINNGFVAESEYWKEALGVS